MADRRLKPLAPSAGYNAAIRDGAAAFQEMLCLRVASEMIPNRLRQVVEAALDRAEIEVEKLQQGGRLH